LHVGPSLPQEPAGSDGRRLGGAEMTRDQALQLLGGYAAGTLTDTEREALFAAALEHQEVFDALAREEPLREALADPETRAGLLAALDPAPRPRAWWQWKPLIASVAMAGLVLGSVAVWRATQRRPASVIVADATPAAPIVTPRPPAIIEPAPREVRKN